ncbi:MAG TPA: four helix bundle protein [Gemmatimonadaceae bacterium]
MKRRDENDKPRGYRGLIVWQMGIEFADRVLTLCDAIPARRGAGLVPQLRRAAISVPSNIAEGYDRPAAEQLTYLRHSRGSLWEAATQLELVKRRLLAKTETALSLLAYADELSRALHGYMRHVGGSDGESN